MRPSPPAGPPADADPDAATTASRRRALLRLVLFLAAANVARSAVVPGRGHFAYNLALGAIAFGIGRLGGLDAAALGFARDRVPAGLRLGGIVVGAITAVLLVAGFAGALGDDRTDVSAQAMLLKALVVIPLGTVLVEEVAFRGVLHGLLVRLTSLRNAVIVGSILFGLWHVFPAWRGADGSAAHAALVAGGTLLATTAAGAGFLWLRVRSDSTVAPMLAHLATNSVAFALSWAFT